MGRQALPPLFHILPLCFTRFMVATLEFPQKKSITSSRLRCALFPYLHQLSWPPPLQLSCASRSQEPYHGSVWVVRMDSGRRLHVVDSV